MSNILSLSNIKKKINIIYDSNNVDRFIVINTRPGRKYIIFTVSNDGLYYNYIISTEGVYIINAVEENRNHYTQQKYERENIAREIYQTVVHTFIKDYKRIVNMSVINSCPVTI